MAKSTNIRVVATGKNMIDVQQELIMLVILWFLNLVDAGHALNNIKQHKDDLAWISVILQPYFTVLVYGVIGLFISKYRNK